MSGTFHGKSVVSQRPDFENECKRRSKEKSPDDPTTLLKVFGNAGLTFTMSVSKKTQSSRAEWTGPAREIGLAFGVPPMLLGIPGDNTYANYAEANRTFWRQTVIPILGKVTDALEGFIGPQFGANLKLSFDLDQVEALSHDRDALWARVNAATFLTADEKRAAVGYGK